MGCALSCKYIIWFWATILKSQLETSASQHSLYYSDFFNRKKKKKRSKIFLSDFTDESLSLSWGDDQHKL